MITLHTTDGKTFDFKPLRIRATTKGYISVYGKDKFGRVLYLHLSATLHYCKVEINSTQQYFDVTNIL